MATVTTTSNKGQVIKTLQATTGGNLTIEDGVYTVGSTIPTDSYKEYRIEGTQTLTSDLDIVINGAGSPYTNTRIGIQWEAVITPAGNAVTIFGATVPTDIVASSFYAMCTYTGSKWVVIITKNYDAVLSVDTANIAAGAVGATELDTDAVTTIKILDLNVTTGKLANLAVTTAKIAALAVTTAEIAATAVTTAKMALLSVTTAIINDLAVTTGKIAALAVTTAKIDDLAVTGAKVAAATITVDKLEANANKYTRDITLSFQQASEVGNVNFTICEDCTIDEINVTVLDPAVTDTATLIYKDNGGVVLTASQTDVTTGLALGNVVSTTPTANNVFSAGDNLLIEMSKTTKTTGKVNVSLCITKT